ncbi:MAG TPA: hypothetical protein VK425_07920 [Acidimicrobiales bacterium]|nr:hypothetical protein [Acidimicrobiales bacterium]
MPDKLEVIPGPGLVARFGDVAVWAGPQATAALQAHLVSEAQRFAQVGAGGEQLANSLIAVLQRGDPEPQSPFAVIGPGANGLTLFLHGPVQAWDSGRWLFPQPVPGWMITAIGRPWPLIVLAYGAPPPPQSQQGNPLDLQTGAVPGSGFVLLRPGQTAVSTNAPGSAAAAPYLGTSGASPSSGPPATSGGSFATAPPASPSVGPDLPSLTTSPPAVQSPSVAGSSLAGPGVARPAVLGPFGSAPPPPAASGPAPAAGGLSDLRALPMRASSPLPQAYMWAAAMGGRPEAVGAICPRGHLNHPRAQACARCGSPLPPGTPQASGPRPAIGALLADDGSIYSLSSGCVIGSDPASAPEVVTGAAQAMTMKAGPNHTMAPVQAAVQLREWTAYLVDRAGGSYVQAPAGDGWSPLAPNEQRELASGSHISCGGRVLTFLSAWPT